MVYLERRERRGEKRSGASVREEERKECQNENVGRKLKFN